MSNQETPDAPQREFMLQRIYVKDVSFEAPLAPQVFTEAWQPETQVGFGSEATLLGNDLYEVILTVTATTKLGERTAYLAEVKQGGIFGIRGFPESELAPMLGAYCPNVLFPYVRELIARLVTDATFPPLLLQPVNFDLVFAQAAQQRALAEQSPIPPAGQVPPR
ncbi:MAG: protein-export chaperone SecB [Pseudomonadota bacterium]